MKTYKIIFEQDRYLVVCDSMVLQNGVTVFKTNDEIKHIAPKQALIIEITEELEILETLKRFEWNIDSHIRDADKMGLDVNGERIDIWQGRKIACEHILREYKQMVTGIKDSVQR